MSEDERPSGNGTVGLLREVIELMKPNGVRRVRIVRGALELDVELDPAAQFLGSEPPTADDGAAEKLAEEKRGKGLCVSSGCEKTGGHMGQPYCRAHFLAEVNGAQTT